MTHIDPSNHTGSYNFGLFKIHDDGRPLS